MKQKVYNKSSILIVLFCSLFLFDSCKKEESTEADDIEQAYFDDLECKFFKGNHSTIVRHESTSYDLVPDVYFDYYSKVVHTQIEFFNYGDDIRLFNGGKENYFIKSIGTIEALNPLGDTDCMKITQVQENETYGPWAYASVYFLGMTINDVFVTPLAYNAYNSGDTSNLLFVILKASERHLVAVFNADSRIINMVTTQCNNILADRDIMNIEAPINGPGRFWKYNRNSK